MNKWCPLRPKGQSVWVVFDRTFLKSSNEKAFRLKYANSLLPPEPIGVAMPEKPITSKDYLKSLIEAPPRKGLTEKAAASDPVAVSVAVPVATTAAFTPKSAASSPAVDAIPASDPARDTQVNEIVQKLARLRVQGNALPESISSSPADAPTSPSVDASYSHFSPDYSSPAKVSISSKEDSEKVSIGAKPPSGSIPPQNKSADFSKVVQELKLLAQEKDVPSVESLLEGKPKTLLEEYGKSRIFRVQGEPLLYYFVPVARPTVSERSIINTLKEVTTRLITITPYRIRDPEQKRNVYRQQVLEILRASPELKVPNSKYDFYAEAVVSEMVGYGLIDNLIKDDRLEEIMVIGPNSPVYVFHRRYDMMITNIQFTDDDEIQDVINRIAREIGRRVDISSPLLDARLPDGSRVNATIPPASVSGSTLTIRKFRTDPYSMIDLIGYKTMTAEAAAFLWLCADGLKVQPANMLISGGTSSGKTTLLNVLCSFIPANERIISIEDTSELSLPLQHWIRLEGRPPGMEGKGELSLDILTKNSLRMRPDRIIVGEVRHSEAFSLFTAMNTGHDGMASADSFVQFGDGSIRELGNFCEKYFKESLSQKMDDVEMVDCLDSVEVIALNKNTLQQERAKVEKIWKRPCKKSYHITTASGKQVKVSYDHPLFRLKDGFMQQVQSHECEEGDYLGVLNEVNITGSDTGKHTAYFLGLLLGDGHLREGVISFTNLNETLHDLFSESIQHIFGVVPKRRLRKNGVMDSIVHSVRISKEINENFHVPFGNKTKIFDVPSQIEKANNKCLGFFLRGMFDTDGHVSSIRKSVCLSTSNPTMAKKIPLLLSRFGIEGRLNVQVKDGKGTVGPYYRIFITGEKNLRRFHADVGFSHPQKAKVLGQIVGCRENTNVDVIPGTGKIIRQIRLAIGLSQLSLAKESGFGNTRTVINAYETGARFPSRNNLSKLNETLIDLFNNKVKWLNELNPEEKAEVSAKDKNELMAFIKSFSTIKEFENELQLKNRLFYCHLDNDAEIKQKVARAIERLQWKKLVELSVIRKFLTHLNAITSESVFWDKIKKIEVMEESASYYDFTLDQFHTFVANGIIISNCLGTIHANSADETLARITSPPMSVPQIMLSGLNFVIVENLFHSGIKGSFRRITEIAEVSGVLQGKPVTHPIFTWDPIKDELVRTNIPVNYLERITQLTGKSSEEMQVELKRRERFLQGLVERKVRDMKTVSLLAQQFVEESK